MQMRLALVVGVAFVLGCGREAIVLDPAVHAAVNELQLKIDECGEGENGACEGTSALKVVAWMTENEDRLVMAAPYGENAFMISFEGGSMLVTEHDEDTGRLRSWTVR